ncbi:MAG: hypothetical protein ACI8UR_001690 [Natronomonas sp.]|jgi:hypothetical protein|uniref:DUF5817 domain-containing protein n=1 Tax=Natronomonas sp. TaxID=2184060 RepID=UPI003989A7FF
MYSVVGCGECHALWVVEGRPDRTQCPRCGKSHQFGKLKQFAETDTSDAAARVRSSMLAERSEDGEFVDPAEIDVDDVGMDDEEFLAASGLDADSVSDAATRAESGQASGGSRSRKQAVLDALDDLDDPTAEEVIEYAEAAGVDESYVERTLTKLQRAGEVTETGGVYRLL